MKLIFGIKSPPVLSEEIFYRDRAEDSFAARVLWLPRLFFSDVRVRTWLDFVGLDGFALAWTGMGWQPLEPGTGALWQRRFRAIRRRLNGSRLGAAARS